MLLSLLKILKIETHRRYKKVIVDEKISRESTLISAYLGTASFHSCPAGRLDREIDRRYSGWTTNEYGWWMDD